MVLHMGIFRGICCIIIACPACPVSDLPDTGPTSLDLGELPDVIFTVSSNESRLGIAMLAFALKRRVSFKMHILSNGGTYYGCRERICSTKTLDHSAIITQQMMFISPSVKFLFARSGM